MKTHVVKPHANRPRHAAGEVVWATGGNYIEDMNATAKMRPVVILQTGACQHRVVGLTTQPTFKSNGESRALLPIHHTCRLCGASYLWSPRPSWLCRLDVRWHIGWIGHEALEVIEQHVRLPWHVRAELRAVADAQSNTDGKVPAATL
jgi:hypothetical protein